MKPKKSDMSPGEWGSYKSRQRKKWAKWQQLSLYDSEEQIEKGKLQRRHAGAVLAPPSYENSQADVPPSPAGNEALNANQISKEELKQLAMFQQEQFTIRKNFGNQN